MLRFLNISLVLLVFMLVAGFNNAYALSCAVPQLTSDQMDEIPIIFEGTVEAIEGPGLIDMAKEIVGDHHTKSTYTFKITKVWKGDHKGATLKILAAPGWAQETAYLEGKDYFVVADEKESAGVYTASPGWCGYDLIPKEQVLEFLAGHKSKKR